MNNEIKQILESKLRDDLNIIARKLRITDYRKFRKDDLVSSILKCDEQRVRRALSVTWWDRYHIHVYGVATFVALVLTIVFYVIPSRSPVLNEKEIESLKPKLTARVTVSDKYEYLLKDYHFKKYHFFMDNVNKDSVPIIGARIKFYFRNKVVETEKNPVSKTGNTVVFIDGFLPKKEGESERKEIDEIPMDTILSEKFSLVIKQYKRGKDLINSNIVSFFCEEWPSKTTFFAKIFTDLSIRPEFFIEFPDKIGTYEGEYSYKIQDKKFTEAITGKIPWNDKDDKIEKMFHLNPENDGLIIVIEAEKLFDSESSGSEFFPHIKGNGIELHGYRENKDLFFLVSNTFASQAILKIGNVEQLRKLPSHPKHKLLINWSDGQSRLYLNDLLVDVWP